MKLDEVCFASERIIRNASKEAIRVHQLETKIFCAAISAGPSGCVCCSHESRGSGLRRRSGSMLELSEYILGLTREKEELLQRLIPVRDAFRRMAGTRSAHVIYYRLYKGLSAAQYGEKFCYSRRHSGRLYIRALQEFAHALVFSGGEDLLTKATCDILTKKSCEGEQGGQKKGNRAADGGSTEGTGKHEDGLRHVS